MASVIDMRYDLICKFTKPMKQAVVDSVLCYGGNGEDSITTALEMKVANMLNKEAALLAPSGTMCNLLALMVHCEKRGSQAFVGDKSFLYKFDLGGTSHIGGITMTGIPNKADGTFCLKQLENRLLEADSTLAPHTSVIVVENTHNMCGGKVIPLEFLDDLSKWVKKRSIFLHMDGARIFYASEHLNVSCSRIVRDFDSITICLGKGLAPVGAMLVGSADFIKQARRYRNVLGGTIRHAGFLATAALISMEEMIPNLGIDRARAQNFANVIADLKLSRFTIDTEVHTNIVLLKIDQECNIKASDVVRRFNQVDDSELLSDCKTPDGQGIIIKVIPLDSKTVRFIFCNQITDEDIRLAVLKITFVLKEFEKNCLNNEN